MNTIVEVHNVYTLYELDEGGEKVDTPILEFFRPQDWGDASRWHYHQCQVQFSLRESTYINNCHIYQEVERDLVSACQEIASYLFMVMMPGTPEQIAGSSHLREDDFWLLEWGPLPPTYDTAFSGGRIPPERCLPYEEDYSPDELA